MSDNKEETNEILAEVNTYKALEQKRHVYAIRLLKRTFNPTTTITLFDYVCAYGEAIKIISQ